MPLRLQYILSTFAALTLISSMVMACGSQPKDVDHDGLRQRADEETSQVR